MPGSVLRESKQIEQRIAHVRDFRTAFTKALALADERWEDSLGAVTHLPSDANRGRYSASLDQLGELAGKALAAAGSIQTTATRFGYSYNPLLQWRDPFRHRGGMASATDVLDACDTVIGILSTRVEQAKAKEVTLAYKIGRLVSFPQRTRSAAGPGRTAQEVAFWGSVAVEVVGGLILLAIPFLVTLAVRSVF